PPRTVVARARRTARGPTRPIRDGGWCAPGAPPRTGTLRRTTPRPGGPIVERPQPGATRRGIERTAAAGLLPTRVGAPWRRGLSRRRAAGRAFLPWREVPPMADRPHRDNPARSGRWTIEWPLGDAADITILRAGRSHASGSDEAEAIAETG